jgi:tetratricopeptide (TPR) repeat protein
MSHFKEELPSLDDMMERCEMISDSDSEFEGDGGDDSESKSNLTSNKNSKSETYNPNNNADLRVEDPSELGFQDNDDDHDTPIISHDENNNNEWKNLDEALACKERGNEFFKSNSLTDALTCYSKAIALCPDDTANEITLAVFYGNRAACYSNLKELELAEEDCTEALLRNPKYIKVLIRRANIYERREKYDQALADLREVHTLDPSNTQVASDIKRITVLHEATVEKMKNEAMDKLKDLGNSILGNFGMSLDNFKMQQDPNTGGWSMSMG